MMLRDLYNKYHAQGFEIYQVSIDPDEHFWKTQTAALPWISVHDDARTDSQVLSQYNVQRIPTFFLIGKDNSVKMRDVQVKDIDAAIKSLLNPPTIYYRVKETAANGRSPFAAAIKSLHLIKG